MTGKSPFKLTYATMFDPPEELHVHFEQALAGVRSAMGREYTMIIGGEERAAREKIEDRSPANIDELLGVFQKGTPQDVHDALTAARKAFPNWSRSKWQDRVALMRKTADLIDERIFEMGSVVCMEVGKNRMEALGDVAEAAELIRYACSQMEDNHGFVTEMGRDPLQGYRARNISILRPYGVWVVISPFNFPCALTAGPMGAALVAGNTVVIKPASDTPWIVRLIVECLRDAGLPDGVFNYVTGPGSTLGQSLIDSPEVDGITFTGSYDVGMSIYRSFAQSKNIRPIIMEMGGKNPAIVSRHANLETAAIGIHRSAFGLQGQKCSACSRVYIDEPVYDTLLDQLVEMTSKLIIGDPAERNVYMGPVINANAYRDFQKYTVELLKAGRFVIGGKIITQDNYSRGYFCEPTLVTDLPREHELWRHEMFLPITIIEKVKDLE
jgi:1-pyrroline-5-carboxylate dehydrogenase